MPAYNCRQCKGSLDPTETVKCPHCGEKKPLICSKCAEPINHHDIHEVAKLKVKKPLLCLSCGNDNQVLKCALCNVGLVRSQGVTVSPLENARIYHKKCLARRREAVGLAHKTAPIAAGICLLLALGLIAYGTKTAGAGAALVGAALFVGIKVFATIIEPR